MMTRDDIIRMAREAGVPDSWDLNWFDPYYERFAALVAAGEREECAKIVDKWFEGMSSEPEMKEIAAEIRARGKG